MNSLFDTLTAFQVLVNENPNLKRMLKGWEPHILLSATDGGERFTLRVKECQIVEILDREEESGHSIRVQAESERLGRIFRGETNPAQEVLEGRLMVFGSEKDQVKLDAISLVLWGV